jgi:hypothetical protein
MSKMGIASSGSLARVFQRLHCTSSDRPLRHVRSSAAASRFVERGGGDFFGGGRSKSAGTRKRARRHHRHAEPLFARHYFTDAAWRAEQRDEVSSREAVLIHKVTDQIGDTRRPTGPFHPRTRQPGALAIAINQDEGRAGFANLHRTISGVSA